MSGNPKGRKRWWKKVKKNRKRTKTSSSADLEREASSTSESGFEDDTDTEDENVIRKATEDFEQHLDSCPHRGKQKGYSE